MNCYKKHLIKKAHKDLIAVEWWNRRTIAALKRAGIFKKYGIAPKGPKKGKECVCLTVSWESQAEKMAQEDRERSRFWIGLLLGGVITLIVTVLASFVIDFIEKIIQ